MQSIFKLTLAAAIALSFASAAVAQDKTHDAHHSAASSNGVQKTAAAAAMTTGEIKKVDKKAGKLTIKHEELKNLGMPAMTMTFRVKNPAMLEQVKAGDKVLFVAQKEGAQFMVTQIEKPLR